jgi:hypothetical protein
VIILFCDQLIDELIESYIYIYIAF